MAYVIRVNRNTNSYSVRRIVRKVVVNRVGKAGKAATIAVGTTSTLPAGSSATVNNTGTSNAAVLNFGIPKGDKGDQGDPATNLVQSVNGKQGVVVLTATDVGADTAGSASQALSQANEYIDEQIGDLATVASTGSYNDLEDKPTIPVVDYPVTSVNGRTGAVTGLAEKAELDMVENELFQDLTDGDVATLASANSYTNVGLATKADAAATQTALNGKQDNISLPQFSVLARATSGTGAPTGGITYSAAASASTLAQRTSAGALNTATPVDGTNATTKAYVDAADALKADFPTINTRVPVRGSSGNQSSIAYSASATGDSLVTRTTLGEVATATPTIASAAVPLSYLESRIRQGTGFPNGVVSAPVGSIYIDTAVTNGASSWIKKSGTGNSGWSVLEGKISYLVPIASYLSGWEAVSGRRIRMTREGDMVTLSIPRYSLTGVNATANNFYQPPSGFVSASDLNEMYLGAVATGSAALNSSGAVGRASGGVLLSPQRVEISGSISYPTNDSWPTTIPV